jgi:hypothetical protein
VFGLLVRGTKVIAPSQAREEATLFQERVQAEAVKVIQLLTEYRRFILKVRVLGDLRAQV